MSSQSRTKDLKTHLGETRRKRKISEEATIVLRKLPFACGFPQLLPYFSQFGPIKATRAIPSKARGLSNGAAWITFHDAETAKQAKKTMNGHILLDSRISVQMLEEDRQTKKQLQGEAISRKIVVEAPTNQIPRLFQPSKRLAYLQNRLKRLNKIGASYMADLVENPIKEIGLRSKSTSNGKPEDEEVIKSVKANRSVRLKTSKSTEEMQEDVFTKSHKVYPKTPVPTSTSKSEEKLSNDFGASPSLSRAPSSRTTQSTITPKEAMERTPVTKLVKTLAKTPVGAENKPMRSQAQEDSNGNMEGRMSGKAPAAAKMPASTAKETFAKVPIVRKRKSDVDMEKDTTRNTPAVKKSAKASVAAAEKGLAKTPVAAAQEKALKTPVAATEDSSAKTPVVAAKVKPAKTPVVTAEETPAKTPIMAAKVKPTKTPVVAAEKRALKTPVVAAEETAPKTPVVTAEETPAKTPVVAAKVTPAETRSRKSAKTPVATAVKMPVEHSAVAAAETPAKAPVVPAEETALKTPVATTEGPTKTPAKRSKTRVVAVEKTPGKTSVKTLAKTSAKTPVALAEETVLKIPVAAAEKTPAKIRSRKSAKTPVAAAEETLAKQSAVPTAETLGKTPVATAEQTTAKIAVAAAEKTPAKQSAKAPLSTEQEISVDHKQKSSVDAKEQQTPSKTPPAQNSDETPNNKSPLSQPKQTPNANEESESSIICVVETSYSDIDVKPRSLFSGKDRAAQSKISGGAADSAGAQSVEVGESTEPPKKLSRASLAPKPSTPATVKKRTRASIQPQTEFSISPRVLRSRSRKPAQ